jgi:hypothetical protein
MVVDAIPSRSLRDSLAQLAQSFQAHEATTSVGQIAECLEELPHSDRSALGRLFSLIHHNTVGVADDSVAPSQIHGADYGLTGTYRHQWPASLLTCATLHPAGLRSSWSAAATRIRDCIGLAGKRTITKYRLPGSCQTEERCRQRAFGDRRSAIGDDLCKHSRRPARNSARSSRALFPAITILGRG